jgi:glycosyltransferase EpsF
MRILQVVPTLGYGGIAQMVINYYMSINKDNLTFDFVTHGKEEDFHKELINSGSKIYYVDTIRKTGLINYFKKMNKILREGKYEIIHFHTGGIRLLLLPISRYCGAKKILVHAHSTKVDKYPKWFWRLWTVHFATHLVACSEEAGKETFGEGVFTIIPNSVNIDNFIYRNNDDLEQLKEEMGIKKDTIVLGHVGVFIEQKNQIFICKLLKNISDKYINFKMIFIGDGPQKSEVEHYVKSLNINDKIIFTGRRNDVNRFMGIFDLFLLPSLYEGLPVAGVEAQVAGCLCLFSKNITREVDLGLGTTRFLDLSNEDEWLKQILEYTKYEKRLDSDFNIRLEESEYNIKVSVKRLERLYGV